ncbi:mycothiol transferase [Rhizocola hellebori]|nr:DUF664 domain-containing protein [Rhizocola hellebori]
MADDILPFTTIADAPMTPDEVEMLLFALERSRALFAWKTGGLDAAALNKRHPPSTLTLGGLIKHLALVEDSYMAMHVTAKIGPPWDSVDFDANPGWDWRTAADDSPEYLYELWQGSVQRSREAVAKALADGGLDQPTRWTYDSGEKPNLRRVLVVLHDEYARHLGHADLLREAIDGLVGEDPPQPMAVVGLSHDDKGRK